MSCREASLTIVSFYTGKLLFDGFSATHHEWMCHLQHRLKSSLRSEVFRHPVIQGIQRNEMETTNDLHYIDRLLEGIYHEPISKAVLMMVLLNCKIIDVD